MTDAPVRCAWATWGDGLMLHYHDDEWGVPVHDDRAFFELLVLEGAQAGLSWVTVLRKRENYRRALDGFDFEKIARYADADVERLLADPGIIRNARKLDAVVYNAQRLIELEEKHKGFRNYLRSHGGFEGTVKDMRKQFKFMGETGCYYFLWVVNEEVPEYEDWCTSRRHTPYPHDH